MYRLHLAMRLTICLGCCLLMANLCFSKNILSQDDDDEGTEKCTFHGGKCGAQKNGKASCNSWKNWKAEFPVNKCRTSSEDDSCASGDSFGNVCKVEYHNSRTGGLFLRRHMCAGMCGEGATCEEDANYCGSDDGADGGHIAANNGRGKGRAKAFDIRDRLCHTAPKFSGCEKFKVFRCRCATPTKELAKDIEPVMEPIVEQIQEPMVEPIVEQIPEIIEPIVEQIPVVEPIVEQIPVAEPIQEPNATPAPALLG